MRTSHIFGIALVFLTLVFLLAAVNFNQPEVAAKNLSAASPSMRIASPTQPAEPVSEVGSTDGIVIMGIVLVFIVTMPVLFRRKRK
jgi:hypothetical protein